MNTKKQGDIGVAAAIFHYTKSGHAVSVPLGDATRYDLIVDVDGVLKRVQIKSSNFKTAAGTYQVQLATSGGNQSWSGDKKFISATECDILFVYCLDGTCYEIPLYLCVGRSSIRLGNKYDEYKV